MVKFTYKLTTLSSLIVSTRSNLAWYGKLDSELGEVNEFSLADIKEDSYLCKDKLKVIYPFYQYGEYKKHAPNSAKYYLPGSSIKGALGGGNPAPGRCMVDDVPVCNGSIVVRNLYKAQYLKEEQEADFKVYFENVGVEMIKSATELRGELYLNDTKPDEFFDAARRSTKEKMKQMVDYLRILNNGNYKKENLRDALNAADANLSALLNDENIYLFGGYKGLLHSMELETAALENIFQKFSSAVFLDPEKKLPHGLTKIEFA